MRDRFFALVVIEPAGHLVCVYGDERCRMLRGTADTGFACSAFGCLLNQNGAGQAKRCADCHQAHVDWKRQDGSLKGSM